MNQITKVSRDRNAEKARSRHDQARPEIKDEDGDDIDWRLLSQVAVVFIGVVVAVTVLGYGRAFFMPVLAAIIVGITLSPLQKFGARHGVPSGVTAILLVAAFCGMAWVVATQVLGAITDWMAKAPEIAETIQEKMRYLERPAAAIRNFIASLAGASGGESQTVSVETSMAEIAQYALAVLRPALTEFLVFFGTLLFFLAGIEKLRRRLIVYFGTREARLTMLRIWSDIEHNLMAYLGTVTAINFALGATTAVMLYALGFANPIALGMLAFVLNYIPYIGPAMFTIILFVISAVTYPTLSAALLPPALYAVLTAVEGNFVTPSIIGRRLTLSPLVVFVALAFWTWLWGPFGAFMATPLLIVALVLLGHMFPRDEAELPK